MQLLKTVLIAMAGTALLAGCSAGGDYPGLEYAPNMYHSVAYEPLTQITDESAGMWVSSLNNGRGEYFNSNKYNPYMMNMRPPAPNTVKRNKNGWLPYRIGKDSLDYASTIKSPLDSTAAIIADGKALYAVYCNHCHGPKGEGDGKVATGVKVDGVDKGMVAGVANLQGNAYLNMTEGHIFHVITWGRNLMQPHGSQISPEDRWKIAKYVKVLQKKK
ncbi:MAG TPA: cytochrome c [Cyclobacteriaceae bacterium]|nr:cytochrome c [Cyclobacteriaceae bacterium]MCB9236825.1 cytochrome c [Flammeovirgaceae bacterium]MCB0498608.1 cytochrome c [Cyclobacteriaceae bacterium]MCO5271573.1 cytochrome c [Cyclobacteriaceae bacterium]MCW5901468.1 cytochrome c [Cyclobacteriaceae bacterium]